MELGRLHCIRGNMIRRDISRALNLVKEYVDSICASKGKYDVSKVAVSALKDICRCATDAACLVRSAWVIANTAARTSRFDQGAIRSMPVWIC